MTTISKWARRALPVWVVLFALPTFGLAGKAEEARIQELEERVAALEKALAKLDNEFDARVASRENRATEALREIMTLVNKGNHVDAKAKMDGFLASYAGTNAARQAARLEGDLSVVGRPAPASFTPIHWYQGEGTPIDLQSDGTQLLVFFEEWCPHCTREVPLMNDTWAKFKDKGLGVIALTKVTKSATDEKVQSFTDQHELQFPVVKESGDMSRYFAIRGIPAAAVVKDGKIIWRGHPNQLNDALIESWL